MNDREAHCQAALDRCRDVFASLEAREERWTARILEAFGRNQVSARHMAGTTGYGYDDIGRDTLERLFAEVFGCEDALVRPQIVSGTHALATCLFGLLGPGDTLLTAAGKPYDTLDEVIGLRGESRNSLGALGVAYQQVDLSAAGNVDFDCLQKLAGEHRPRVVLIQRSKGYAWRPSLDLRTIGKICGIVRRVSPDSILMIDNCYGEFVEDAEPNGVGADILVGSLIKNPGGGLAPTGGYIAGKKELIEQVADRLTSPGIGREVGSYAYGYQAFYQGLFWAPHVVTQALKTAIYAASVFDLLGFPVEPAFDCRVRTDIIQAIELQTERRLLDFCQAIQSASPVDAHVRPEPWAMPGYAHQVVMAAGTFVSGASIELSADAPIKPPYVVYMQGGLTFSHGKRAVECVVERLWGSMG